VLDFRKSLYIFSFFIHLHISYCKSVTVTTSGPFCPVLPYWHSPATWWHSPANLTEGFPCFFLSCKANARVYLAKTGHGPHSS
jgi:hypothetical protein